MNVLILSYSFTGNNKALASSLAKELSAEHIEITEHKKRTTGKIIFDVIFNRIPKVKPEHVNFKKFGLILFVAPVWMGHAASPIRIYLKQLKAHPRYAFVSISGGALNTNPKLADDLQKRAGTEPMALVDLHISDLLPSNPKPTMKDTSAYRINANEIKKLTDTIIIGLKIN